MKKKRIKLDKIHYQIRKLDSYNKKFNFIISPRCLGKSTVLWRKAYKKFKQTDLPVLVIRRYIADITDTYIHAAENTINKFLEEEKRIQFKYIKGSIDGHVDIFINDKHFARIIALNTKESRLKSSECPTTFMMFDEFICNNLSESYLKDECNKFNSLYTTYSRAHAEIFDDAYEKVYFAGNPYSVMNPYMSSLIKVDLYDIKPGCFLVGSNYIIDCPSLSDELVQWCIDHGLWDPDVDDEYNRYAFGGEAINDRNIRIVKTQPNGYYLKYAFAINRKLLGVYKNGTDYWCALIKETSKTIISVDFDNLMTDAKMISTDMRINMSVLKRDIQRNLFTYQSVEAGYLLQSIYTIL